MQKIICGPRAQQDLSDVRKMLAELGLCFDPQLRRMPMPDDLKPENLSLSESVALRLLDLQLLDSRLLD